MGGMFIWCRYPWKPEAMDTPRAGFGEGCELPDTGVRNWTWALCKTVCTPLNHWVISTVLAMIYLFRPGVCMREGGVNSGPAVLPHWKMLSCVLLSEWQALNQNPSIAAFCSIPLLTRTSFPGLWTFQTGAHFTGGRGPGFEMLKAGLFWMLESFDCDSSNVQTLKGCSNYTFFIWLYIFHVGVIILYMLCLLIAQTRVPSCPRRGVCTWMSGLICCYPLLSFGIHGMNNNMGIWGGFAMYLFISM